LDWRYGVLVFILAVIPKTDMIMMHLLRAEAPGPVIGKLVAKMRLSARILYGIYVLLTVILIIFLVAGKMPFFDSVVTSFATAGTGGFGIKNNSIAFYDSAYIDIVLSIFMILFGVNFNIYYLMLLKNFKRAFKNDELRWYLSIIIISVVAVAINIYSIYPNIMESLRHSFFQVSSIITTTGLQLQILTNGLCFLKLQYFCLW
jgi:trk system potassium uptake protein TrkH